MNAPATFNAAEALASLVDELGAVKADIAALQEREKELIAKLKLTGLAEINGSLFRATVSTSDRETVKTKELREALGEDLIAPFLSSTSVTTVRVAARKTSK
jgi:hypothetical protein